MSETIEKTIEEKMFEHYFFYRNRLSVAYYDEYYSRVMDIVFDYDGLEEDQIFNDRKIKQLCEKSIDDELHLDELKEARKIYRKYRTDLTFDRKNTTEVLSRITSLDIRQKVNQMLFDSYHNDELEELRYKTELLKTHWYAHAMEFIVLQRLIDD